MSGASNPKEIVVTAWLLERAHNGKVADIRRGNCAHTHTHACLYTVLEHKHTKFKHALTHIHPSGGWAMILRLMQ